MPIQVFCSYSSKDERYRAELETHLSILRRRNVIETWTFRNIEPGVDWNQAIARELSAAAIILLLISADFLNSDYCYDIELRTALKKHQRGEATVIPIILRDCDWESAAFAHLQVLPRAGRPVLRWPSRDTAWKDVEIGIRTVAERLARIEADRSEFRTTGGISLEPAALPTVSLAALQGTWRDDFAEGLYYPRIIGGEFLVPYSYTTNSGLQSHFYNVRQLGPVLAGRFAWFDGTFRGHIMVRVENNDTMAGSWWFDPLALDDRATDLIPDWDLDAEHSIVLRRIDSSSAEPSWLREYVASPKLRNYRPV